MIKLEKIRIVFLVLATFFNPLGFDALFALTMQWTGSYLVTDIIFYCISIFFFLCYYLSSRGQEKSSEKVPRLRKKKPTKGVN